MRDRDGFVTKTDYDLLCDIEHAVREVAGEVRRQPVLTAHDQDRVECWLERLHREASRQTSLLASLDWTGKILTWVAVSWFVLEHFVYR